MIALALDTSSMRTGYVRGPVDGSGPLTIDSFSLPDIDKNDIGAKLFAYREALRPRMHGADVIFMERPAMPFGSLNFITLFTLYSIAGLVELMAIDAGLPCYDVQNGKHKALIYGKGGAKPKNTVELARSWGFHDAQNEDEADACGVFLTCTKIINPSAFLHWQNIKANSPMVPFIPKPKKKKRKKK